MTALSIGVIFGFQPIMTTLIAWPFMAFQFICLSLSAISFYFLVQYAQTANRVRLWQALVFGYLTMHTLGTGLAVSLSVLFTATLLIALRWYSVPDRKLLQLLKSLVPVYIVSILTAGHAILMTIGITPDTESEKVSLLTTAIRFGGLLIEMLHNSLKYLWAPGGLSLPELRGLEADSVYGWGLVLLVMTAVISHCLKYLKAPADDQSLVRIVLLTAPSLTLCLIVAMISYRAQTVADDDILISYIIGDRYLIFSSFFGFLFCVGLFLNSKQAFSKTAVACLVIAASVSLAGNTTFMLTTAREIWPTKNISHTQFWNDLKEAQRSDPEFQSDYWDQSVQPVTELDATRLSFKPLIERQLQHEK
ncbi:hypothetical protein [Gimesia sp.]|uniref:hypothetical protein n=1 Tax=Gimesia sp. TaxID=2024833 RepID=UPI003A9496EF